MALDAHVSYCFTEYKLYFGRRGKKSFHLFVVVARFFMYFSGTVHVQPRHSKAGCTACSHVRSRCWTLWLILCMRALFHSYIFKVCLIAKVSIQRRSSYSSRKSSTAILLHEKDPER